MAGAGLKINFRGLKRVLTAITKTKAAVQGNAHLMQKIGMAAKRNIQSHFRAGKSPTGAPWLPLKYGRAKNGKARGVAGSAKPLRDTGRLMGSIDILETKKGSVIVGTNVIYAATHEFGDDNRVPVHAARLAFQVVIGGRVMLMRPKKVSIPARPFMGLNAYGRADINRIIDSFTGAMWK